MVECCGKLPIFHVAIAYRSQGWRETEMRPRMWMKCSPTSKGSPKTWSIGSTAGPAWGTRFSELEETVGAIRKALTERMLHQALERQAAQAERPADYNVCP